MSRGYAATLEATKGIPPKLIAVFKGGDVVKCLRTQYGSYLNEFPFMFSEEKSHVWQVLDALEAVLGNHHDSFSNDKEGDELDERIFCKFVSLAHQLKDEGLVEQLWMIVLLHDIAKYGVQNADHAQMSGELVGDLFKVRDFGLSKQVQERIAWVIGNHDVVGNIVSTAERAPRCLTDRLVGLPDQEKQTRLNMLILLSFCDLRGTLNGRFVNDYNAESRFLAADFTWLENTEENLFRWRKDRLVRASTVKDTEEKQNLWNTTFGALPKETRAVIERQFGRNIKVFTNLLYIALRLTGEELVMLFAVISLIAEAATRGVPNPDFQVDFTEGAGRDKPGPIVDRFKALLTLIKLDDLTLHNMRNKLSNQTIYNIPISVTQDKITIDSKKLSQTPNQRVHTDTLRREGSCNE